MRAVLRRRRLWLYVVNCASVTTGPARAEAVVRKATANRRAGLIFLSECADFRLHELVDGAVWQVIQFGDLGDAESGCALLARRNRVRLRFRWRTVYSREGEGIRTRTAVGAWADVNTTLHKRTWEALAEIASTHLPPDRAPVRQRQHALAVANEIRAHRHGCIVGADWNMSRGEMRAYLGDDVQIRLREVLGIAATGHRLGRARTKRVGSDHPGVLVPLLLPKPAP